MFWPSVVKNVPEFTELCVTFVRICQLAQNLNAPIFEQSSDSSGRKELSESRRAMLVKEPGVQKQDV